MLARVSLVLVCLASCAPLSACTSIFDYSLAPTSNDRDAATRSDSESMTQPPQPGIWRRDAAAADGGELSDTGTAAATGGSGSTPARAAASSDDDTDAGVASRDDPTVTLPPSSAALNQAGLAALADWAGLPSFGAANTRVFSTHERDGSDGFPLIDPGNKDFNSFLAVCGDRPALVAQQNDRSVECGPGETGYLIAADDGPGYVSRILLARGISNPSSSVLVDLRPTDERIRIYVDGAQVPSFEGLWSDLATGLSAPFDAPLTGWTSGATVSYLPISYSSRLRVFVDALTASSFTLYYAQVSTHRVAKSAPFDGNALAAADTRAVIDDVLTRPRSAGTPWLDESVALDGTGAWTVWTRDQPGTLQRLELQLEAATAQEVMNETVLRLRWDGAPAAIDLSLALLFGARHALAPLATLPLTVQIDDKHVLLQINLPMPFAERAQLELVHATPSQHSVQLRLYGSAQLPAGEWGRLHSVFSEQRDPQPGEHFQVAALSGRGNYLGTIMYMRGQADATRSVRASELGFLEGDERLELDGQLVSVGTGTDNYFNGGFYFKDGLFNAPFAAVSQLAVDEAKATSEATMLRWTILSEALRFQTQLSLSFEFGADRPATARDYAAVSFYYQ